MGGMAQVVWVILVVRMWHLANGRVLGKLDIVTPNEQNYPSS